MFYFLFILALTALYLGHLFTKLLKELYPEVWEQLGEPEFLNYSMRTIFMTARFLYKNEYKKLKSSQLTRIGNYLKTTHLIFYILFGLYVVFLLIFFLE